MSAPAGRTLATAFTADTQPPDPDVFYAGQGLLITTNVYDGLLQYAPDTAARRIIPDLAESYSVSPDGLTYTFHLRPGVTFHDGTPLTSQAVAASFARRLAVNSAPAYMLADLAGVSTPSPLTAVVHLKKPDSAFLDYLASPYGPRLLSPAALAAHKGSDNDQTWLRTHDAGTGPYTIASVVPGQEYVLKAYPGYWGTPKPYYTTVTISITPSTETQQLELENGQLQLLTNDYLPGPAISALKANSKFTVTEVPTLEMPMIWVNPRGVFAARSVRLALAQAVNRPAVVAGVFPGRAQVAAQIYPAGVVAAGTATFSPSYDPAALTHALAGAASKKVTLGYQADDPTSQQMANIVQTELAAAGLAVQVVAIPQATIYNYPGHPGAGEPDLLIETNWPDAFNPDTWARIVMSASGGLNYLNCSVPAGDALLDAGLTATTPAEVARDYQQAGDAYVRSGCWLPIADKEGTVVTANYLTGVTYRTAVPKAIDLAALRPR